ncbi:SAM-dependent methyltransferase [Streptomyces sp. SBT349]|uniref:SAM-dependent methyltransferase n=1 Tax=Streptomyces sp. SBT349 TaxID=1580539 RepID=UPI00066EF00E|nr:SAM-dependent methyltransferase [Streptomyces sp. SBT349]
MLEDEIDASRPDPARVYDFFLRHVGGKSYYPVDEQAGSQVEEMWPGVSVAARANRAFVLRSTRWLAKEAGVRQFLDIGTGIPSEPNLHQVAQAVAPEARVVYTDNRRIVLLYAEALMSSAPEGRTAYLHADFADPESILRSRELGDVLDLDRPVALSLNALLHYIADDPSTGFSAHELVRRYTSALPAGSYLVLTHVTPDFDPPTWRKVTEGDRSITGQTGQIRDRAEVERFFEGLDLVDPGLVPPHRWHPDGPVPEEADDVTVSMWAGVGRVPGS